MVASFVAPIQSNSTYIHKVRRSIYDIRRPEYPHLEIRLSMTTPMDPLHGPITHERNYRLQETGLTDTQREDVKLH